MEIGKIFQTKIGDKDVFVETGKYCGQANGHCIVSCGETRVMVNVTMAKEPRPGMDFFPLGVDYEEPIAYEESLSFYKKNGYNCKEKMED